MKPIEYMSLTGLKSLNDFRAGSIMEPFIDAAWDSLASLVAYGDVGSGAETVEERFEADSRLKALRDELARIEARGRKERQVARKNALFDKAKELKRQIAAIEEGR